MDMILLTRTDRAEIARLYVRHLGETSLAITDKTTGHIVFLDPSLCPTRQFMGSLTRYLAREGAPLTAEEILTCLQITLHPSEDGSPPYYTADPAFLSWLEHTTLGWPILWHWLDDRRPPWFCEYVKTLEADVQAAEDSDKYETHASMQGVAEACNQERNVS